jgi:hypothetical protein
VQLAPPREVRLELVALGARAVEARLRLVKGKLVRLDLDLE